MIDLMVNFEIHIWEEDGITDTEFLNATYLSLQPRYDGSEDACEYGTLGTIAKDEAKKLFLSYRTDEHKEMIVFVNMLVVIEYHTDYMGEVDAEYELKKMEVSSEMDSIESTELGLTL